MLPNFVRQFLGETARDEWILAPQFPVTMEHIYDDMTRRTAIDITAPPVEAASCWFGLCPRLHPTP